MFGLEYFSFSDVWSPWFMMLMLLITAAYFCIVGPLSNRFAFDTRATAMQKFLFTVGIFLFYLAQGGPISLLSHLMFSFHMLAMAISYVLVPPLILLGIPTGCWRWMFQFAFWRKLKFLMHPILTALIFNGLFSFYHIPAVHDYVMLHFVVHRIYYVVLLGTSIMMWWPILTPIPESGKLQDLRKIAYIFMNSILITPACALIIFAPHALYATYTSATTWAQAMGFCYSGDPAVLLQLFQGPSFFGLLEPAQDQQVGGIVMKFVQEFVYMSVLAYTCFHWFRRESRDDTDELPIAGPENWNRA